MFGSNDSPGRLEELEQRKNGAVSQVADLVEVFTEARQDAERMLSDVEDARERLDQVEDDAKAVKNFVDSLPDFEGGEH